MDFHPEHASPWKEIVCCRHNVSQIKTFFTIDQIKNSLSYYPEFSGNQEVMKLNEIDEVLSDRIIDETSLNELPMQIIPINELLSLLQLMIFQIQLIEILHIGL